MKTLSIVVACLLALIVSGIIWYWQAHPTYTYRYRLTVEVEVDGQVRSGAGVIQVTWQKLPRFGDAPPWKSEVKGQAIFVDLGAYGGLLALPSAPGGGRGEVYHDGAVDAVHLAPRAFAGMGDIPSLGDFSGVGYPSSDSAFAAMSRLRAETELRPGNLPRLVFLPEKSSPRTARLVRPDQLQKIAGPSVRLRRIVIATTDDPITTDLSSNLPWLKSQPEASETNATSTPIGDFPLTRRNLSIRVEP